MSETKSKKGNASLKKAKATKNDEFYTQITDIEKELKHYREHFKDKVVFCNCDDPQSSNFWKFFFKQFEVLGLKKLISTHYVKDNTFEKSYVLIVESVPGVGVFITENKDFEGNGDFRSEECIEYLKQADIVVTNPPFSLFREYVAQLMEYEKKFLIIGNMNAITYKEFFPLLKDNKVWIGYNAVKEFKQPDGTMKQFGNICWFTNLDIKKRHENLILTEKYTPENYPKYDNYDAIEVSKVADIPKDYDGVMGVPITFLDKYNPEQFEIIGLAPERLSEDEASLQIKRYVNAIQHNKDGSTQSGNKVNDGPAIVWNAPPSKYPYYTSETVPNKFLQVLYARILIRRKQSK